MTGRSPGVEIRIDEMVLHGVDAARRYDVASGLRDRLTELFGATDSVPTRACEESSRRLPEIVVHDPGARRLGAAIAEALHEHLAAGDR